MKYRIKRFFAAFIEFWEEYLKLPFSVRVELFINLITVITVCGFLYGLVTSLGQILEILESVNDSLDRVHENLLSTQVEIIKVQDQLTELTDEKDMAKLKEAFGWRNVLTTGGIAIVGGVAVVFGFIVMGKYFGV